MGVRCSDCSRHFKGVGELDGHPCEGNSVTILVIKPGTAVAVGENPARVFESRVEAEQVREDLDAPTRIVDAPLIRASDTTEVADE